MALAAVKPRRLGCGAYHRRGAVDRTSRTTESPANSRSPMYLDDQIPVCVINRPASAGCGNATYIGPTEVDLTPLAESAAHHAAPREAKLLARWKAQDLAAYHRQLHSNEYRTR